MGSRVVENVSGRTERKLHNRLLGGELLLEWPDDGASVVMTGPVATVFVGDWHDGMR